MIYISKGTGKRNVKGELIVTRCGKAVNLSGLRSDLWRRGQSGFAATNTKDKELALQDLTRLGLVEFEKLDTPTARYWLLTYCTLRPVRSFTLSRLTTEERIVLRWLKKAGLRITIAELVYLVSEGIRPTRDLLRAKNRQALVEKIYTPWNISDNLLEQQMESDPSRDLVVETVLGLLKKKRIVLI